MLSICFLTNVLQSSSPLPLNFADIQLKTRLALWLFSNQKVTISELLILMVPKMSYIMSWGNLGQKIFSRYESSHLDISTDTNNFANELE